MFRVWGSGRRDLRLECRVQGIGFQGAGFGGKGLMNRVLGSVARD